MNTAGSTRIWRPDASCATRVIKRSVPDLRSVARRVSSHPAGTYLLPSSETETQSHLWQGQRVSPTLLVGQVNFFRYFLFLG